MGGAAAEGDVMRRRRQPEFTIEYRPLPPKKPRPQKTPPHERGVLPKRPSRGSHEEPQDAPRPIDFAAAVARLEGALARGKALHPEAPAEYVQGADIPRSNGNIRTSDISKPRPLADAQAEAYAMVSYRVRVGPSSAPTTINTRERQMSEVADKILARAFDELVDAGLDSILAATAMARTGLREMPHAACCATCLNAALRAVGEQLDALIDDVIEEARANAAVPVEVMVH
jgi:hypothetical protein